MLFTAIGWPLDPRAVAIDGGHRVAEDFRTAVGRFFGHSATTFSCGHRVADVTYDHPVTTLLFAVVAYCDVGCGLWVGSIASK